MKQTLLQEKYPIFVAEIAKTETSYKTVEALVDYYKGKIAENPKVQFIGVFDHYAHTRKIEAPMQPANQVMEAWTIALRNA